MTYENLKAHPLADLFPMIDKDDFPAFMQDIEERGLTDKIILHEGKILDGRNRYRALTELGLTENALYYTTFDALGLDMLPFDYVVSKNLQRRHLNESQRALVAAKTANMRQGERTDLSKDAPLNDDAPLDTSAPSAEMRKVSQGDAAKLFRVSERMVTGANKVLNDGIEILGNLVEAGELPVTIAEQVAKLPRESQEKVMANTKPKDIKSALKRHDREQREAALAEKQSALPIKKYGVIYADPEWRFETYSAKGMDRAAGNHYPTSPVEDIMRRRVQDIAADDCVLFMWATVPCLIEAICVLEAWGFVVLGRDPITGHMAIDRRKARYVSHWAWIKQKIAHGYWGRNQHEILLIATKGNPVAPAMGTQPASAIETVGVAPEVDAGATAQAPATEHSAKPDLFAEWIERLFPTAPKIELNARRKRPGWDVWGNEAPDNTPLVIETTPENAIAEGADDGAAWDAANPDIGTPIDPKALAKADEDAEWDAAAPKETAPGYRAPDKMPKMEKYEGKHTAGTDALIRYGYANKTPIVLICAWLGLPERKKGIVKGRANRLGLTDPKRIIENNKARAKGNDDGETMGQVHDGGNGETARPDAL